MTAHKALPIFLSVILGSSPATADSFSPNRLPVRATSSPQTPETLAAAHIVIDLQSRQTLSAKNIDAPAEPAALAQLMTAYLVFKNLKSGNIRPEETLKINESAWKSEGSRMFVRPGGSVRTDTLLKGMIVLSANDAALTLAGRLGNGSIENFVQQMNKEAKRLGMNHTVFKNPTGLSQERQVSTARDLSLLAEALMRDFPEYYPLFSIKSFKFENIGQNNRNTLLYRDSGVNGLKAGHTESGGYNLAVSYSGNGRHILVITLGSESAETRASDSSKLLNRALQSFDTPKIYSAGEMVTKIPVFDGSKKTVRAGFPKAAYITVPHTGAKTAEQILETIQPVPAPVKKGQVLGKIKIRQNGYTLAEKEIVALENVEKRSRWQRLWTRLTGQ
ncbi:TPA: D-alanyl-D-alanine carboxypeptidase family protein [Neisseria lactamica]